MRFSRSPKSIRKTRSSRSPGSCRLSFSVLEINSDCLLWMPPPSRPPQSRQISPGWSGPPDLPGPLPQFNNKLIDFVKLEKENTFLIFAIMSILWFCRFCLILSFFSQKFSKNWKFQNQKIRKNIFPRFFFFNPTDKA